MIIDVAAERWRRLRPLLDRAIDLEGEERAAYLQTLRADERELRDDLERLVAEHERLQCEILPSAAKLVARALAREFQEDLDENDAAIGERTGGVR